MAVVGAVLLKLLGVGGEWEEEEEYGRGGVTVKDHVVDGVGMAGWCSSGGSRFLYVHREEILWCGIDIIKTDGPRVILC